MKSWEPSLFFSPTKGERTAPRVRVPILYYHRVEENLDPTKGVSPRVFDKQMAYLQRKGFYSIALEDLASYFLEGRALPSRPVAITFDDGYLDNFTHGYPILKRRGFTATVFLVSAYIGRTSAWEGCRGEDVAPLMSRENIREMLADGFHFGGHTRTHCKLISVPETEARDEVKGGKEDLESLLQRPIPTFAYPYGDFDEKAVEIVKDAGFVAARTVHTGNTHRREDLLTLRCVKINGRTPMSKFRYYLTGIYHLETMWHERRRKNRNP